MTLPGLEADAEPPVDPADSLGLSGRWSVTSGEFTVIDLIKVGGKWLALFGVVVVTMITVVLFWPTSTPVVQVDRTLPPGAHDDLEVVVAPDSLGVKLGDLTQTWNEVEAPPRISGGLIRSPETGRFDSFTYRFNTSSLIAGAYDKSNEYLYALMVSTWISDENATRMSIHLCHVVSPFSQECIDAYYEQGLGRQPIDQYRDVEHRAEWTVGESRWRLSIVDNIQTIRVLSPGAG